MSELRDEWLADIARTGQAYRNEVRAMADELIELRRKLNEPDKAAADSIQGIPQNYEEIARTLLTLLVGNTLTIDYFDYSLQRPTPRVYERIS